jgi:hypothetical protein
LEPKLKHFTSVEFLSCEKRLFQGRPHYYIKSMVETPTGPERFDIQMPTDTLDWRAAEYGIDHTDVDQLWDITLAEFFMNEEDYGDDPQLYTHLDMDEVRKAHIGRVAKVKWALRMATRTKGSVHEAAKAIAQIHPEALDLKTRHVALLRAEHVPRHMMAKAMPQEEQEQTHEERMRHLRMMASAALNPEWPTEEDNNG